MRRLIADVSGFLQPFRHIGRWLATLLLVLTLAGSQPTRAGDAMVCQGGPKDGSSCTTSAECTDPAAPDESHECTANDIRAYAADCYKRLEIQPLSGPFQCKDSKAHQLVTTVDGVIQDIHCPKDSGNSPVPPYKPCEVAADGTNVNKAATFPVACDNPAWLPNTRNLGTPETPRYTPTQCYGNSYIQKVPGIVGTDGDPSKSVLGALQCRKKKTWDDNDNDFTDIAMVLHNKENGETCWFQTSDSACFVCNGGSKDGTRCDVDANCSGGGKCNRPTGDTRCNGGHVPAPDTKEAAAFWWKPSQTGKLNCVRCHDNGPWMNSRWISNTIELEDDLGKYVNHGYGISTPINVGPGVYGWKVPAFVTVGRAGLEDRPDVDECTKCHKIHAAAKTPDPEPTFFRFLGRDYQTFANWLDFTVGNDGSWALKTPEQAKYTGAEALTGTGLKIAYWMPKDHGTASSKEWLDIFKKHVTALRECMNADEADRQKLPDDTTKKVKDCQEVKPEGNKKPSSRQGARIYASLDGGATTPYSFDLHYAEEKNDPIGIKPGAAPVVYWEGDSTYSACSIEATFPDAYSENHFGTGSNWTLADGNVSVGKLMGLGKYRFDLHCGGNMAASLTFDVCVELPKGEIRDFTTDPMPGVLPPWDRMTLLKDKRFEFETPAGTPSDYIHRVAVGLGLYVECKGGLVYLSGAYHDMMSSTIPAIFQWEKQLRLILDDGTQLTAKNENVFNPVVATFSTKIPVGRRIKRIEMDIDATEGIWLKPQPGMEGWKKTLVWSDED